MIDRVSQCYRIRGRLQCRLRGGRGGEELGLISRVSATEMLQSINRHTDTDTLTLTKIQTRYSIITDRVSKINLFSNNSGPPSLPSSWI